MAEFSNTQIQTQNYKEHNEQIEKHDPIKVTNLEILNMNNGSL